MPFKRLTSSRTPGEFDVAYGSATERYVDQHGNRLLDIPSLLQEPLSSNGQAILGARYMDWAMPIGQDPILKGIESGGVLQIRNVVSGETSRWLVLSASGAFDTRVRMVALQRLAS